PVLGGMVERAVAADRQCVAGSAAGIRFARVDAPRALVFRPGVRDTGAHLRRERAEDAEPRDSADARGLPDAGPAQAWGRRTALGLSPAHRVADRGGGHRDRGAGRVVPLRAPDLAQAPAALARHRVGGAVRRAGLADR